VRHWIEQLGIVGASSAIAMLLPLSARASETVIFKYGPIRESISVAELTTFVETGELSRSLKTYLRQTNTRPEQLRSLMTDSVAMDGVALSGQLNAPLGELALDQLSRYIHTPDDKANRPSLRSALVLSALPDGEIALIEVLQNYPTREVHVEGERLHETLIVFNQLRQHARAAESISLPGIDLDIRNLF